LAAMAEGKNLTADLGGTGSTEDYVNSLIKRATA
jgi:hypothetical protein